MPSRRAAFTLLELMVSLAMVVVLALAGTQYFGGEPEKAMVTRAAAELKSLQKQVQASALKVHGYHFDTLEQALERDEPLLDPWGHPYVLMHGTFQYSYTPEADYWASGTSDALYSDTPGSTVCRSLRDHFILSAGPNHDLYRKSTGTYDPQADDLKILVKLGMPPGTSPAAGDAPSVFQVDVPVRSVLIRVSDFAAADGDRITLTLNGVALASDISLLSPPGASYPCSLTAGKNVVQVRALNEGANSPNTVLAEVSPVSGGSGLARWGLFTNTIGTLEITAP